jgi:hypothetical protein
MAFTRVGLGGSIAALNGFDPKEEAVTPIASGSRFRYGYRLAWASLWLLMIGRWHG